MTSWAFEDPAIPVKESLLSDFHKLTAASGIAKMSNSPQHGIVIRALHKCASMFLFKFFADVASDAGVPFYSINNTPPDEDSIDSTRNESFCVGPIRHFNQSYFTNFPGLDEVTQICQIRDPRDMVVSEYFSMGWIHSDQHWSAEQKKRRAEIQHMTIDEYVIHQPQIAKHSIEERFQPLLELDLNRRDIVVVHYETMVTQFHRWVHSAIRPFQFRWPGWYAAKYAWKYRNEFKPAGENSHKRRITPGDHIDKLQPSTIQILNQRYAPILNRFQYRSAKAA